MVPRSTWSETKTRPSSRKSLRYILLLPVILALTHLEQIDPQMASIVELPFFGGLTIDETAEVTGNSTAAVEGEWATARMWLLRQMHENQAT